jgi:hypothetical protein
LPARSAWGYSALGEALTHEVESPFAQEGWATSRVTYRRLDEILRSLGFAFLLFEERTRVYKHEPTGALVVIPDLPQDDTVLPHHLVAVRAILDAYAIADSTVLTEMLHQSSQPQSSVKLVKGQRKTLPACHRVSKFGWFYSTRRDAHVCQRSARPGQPFVSWGERRTRHALLRRASGPRRHRLPPAGSARRTCHVLRSAGRP